MYRNTMYIPTITSWLTQSMAKLHRHKNRIVSLTLIKHFSSRCRTSNKNNTEYRTSVQKNYFVTPKQRKLWKETNSETIFHSNRSHSLWHSSLLKSKIWNNKFNLILDIFFFTKLMLPKLQTLHCNGILIFKTITVIVPLQKFRITWQRSYYERSQ